MTSSSTPVHPAALLGRAMRGEPCSVLGLDEVPWRLPVRRWTQEADPSDAAVLAHCSGPLLDIGCGPGRMGEFVAAQGVEVLGVDVVPEAVAQTRSRGVAALRRNVFDELPGEGRWRCALLADGNIGIGGDPLALLARVAELLAPGGWVVADVAPPGTPLRTHSISLECGGQRSETFDWAVLGPEAITEVAHASGFSVAGLHHHGDRWFAILAKAH